MLRRKSVLALATSMALFLSGCQKNSTASTASQGCEQVAATADQTGTTWDPKWNTRPDKNKEARPQLVATVAFADEGFAGSPVPENLQERRQGEKDRDIFAQAFQNEPECFGVTLMQKNPQGSDFRLQIFDGIYGRTGKLEWVLYRMDTSGELSHGETTGRPDNIAKSVCESMRPLVTLQGGNVQ